MNKVIKLLAKALFTVSVMILYGCRKDAAIPTLVTKDVNQITETTAVTGGMVYSAEMLRLLPGAYAGPLTATRQPTITKRLMELVPAHI